MTRLILAYLLAATGLATVFGLFAVSLPVAVPVAVFVGIYIGVLVPRRIVVRPTITVIRVVVHRDGDTYIAHCAATGTDPTPAAAIADLNATLHPTTTEGIHD